MKQSKTIVVFRKFKDDGGVIALFPHEIADHNGNCSSYMRIGQHSPADYSGLIGITRLATPSEYASLKRELESIGYQLTVRVKFNRKAAI